MNRFKVLREIVITRRQRSLALQPYSCLAAQASEWLANLPGCDSVAAFSVRETLEGMHNSCTRGEPSRSASFVEAKQL